MKGVVFLGDRQAEVREFEDVGPGPEEVRIRLRSSGMCGSDLNSYRQPAAERSNVDIRPGHEPCGEVAELGAGVTEVSVGDRVMIHHYKGCGHCRYCREGYNQLCLNPGPENLYYGGSAHGGHGETMVCAARLCVPLPDELSFDEGAMLACGTSTAWLALEKMDVSGRDTVAIFGQGPVGLAGTMLAVAMGARVIAVDLSDARLAMATEAGAAEVVNPANGDVTEQIRALTNGEGADASLEAAGAQATRKAAATSVRVFGRTALVGERGEVTWEATPDIIHRHLTIYGSWTVSIPGMAETARFVVDKKVPLQSMVTGRVAIDDAPAAYERFDRQDTGKMVIAWD